METVGERLRETRKRRVLSQEDLAARSGVPVVTISRLENGHTEPRPQTIRRLAAALDVDPSWLLFGNDEVEGNAAA